MAKDVFGIDYRRVDHDAQADRQTAERHYVESDAESAQENETDYDGDRDRDRGYGCRTLSSILDGLRDGSF